MTTWNFEFGIPSGLSAYDVAVANGFVGTEQEWLASLVGAAGTNGTNGESAYQIWLDQGNTGTEQDFLDSIAATAVADITFTASATALSPGSQPTVQVTTA